VVIQLGAILAVVVSYQRRLRALIGGFCAAQSQHQVPPWRHALVLVLVGVVPAGLVGTFAQEHIVGVMEDARPIGIALPGGGRLIALIDRACRGRGWIHDAADASPGQAIGIGVAQAVALIPGSSRSACTIMGGRLLGLDMRAAADFSFLLSIPTMFAAAL